MRLVSRVCLAAGFVAISLAVPPLTTQNRDAEPADLVGLWQAKRRFGPDVRGRLVIDRPAAEWRASIAGRTAVTRIAHDSVWFALPDGGGSFIGRFDARRSTIVGHWIQPRTVTDGNTLASPIVLASCGTNCFNGNVVPRDEEFTFYIKVSKRPPPDGALGAFIRNPERNLGRFIRLDHIEIDGKDVKLLDAKGASVAQGVMRDGVLTVYIENRGGSYDFRKVPDDSFTDFYARGRPTASYTYVPPRQQNDGWPVGTLDEVGMSAGKISEMMQSIINAPADSIGVHKPHGILIARHGKLVVEEYFYGEHGDKTHDTRSASKTVTTVLLGAAMQAGAKINPGTSVYSVMQPAATNIEPRKRALTLEHLLTMSSGLDCDDNSDTYSPGSEDAVTQQDTNPDWYRMILGLGMVRDPGVQSVYCSINPHLAGGVISRATGRSLPDLMWELVGQPLGMQHYYIQLTPLGEGYMGGGWRFRPRDFMKLGQLYLNGGTWGGRRVLSEDWVKRSTEPRYPMGSLSKYGYLWWVWDYPYEGRKVQAYFASRNGGQYVMVIPKLDLVFAAYGGNYNDAANWTTARQLVPRYVLAAVLPVK
ncbi:MAG: serine hydrolase domain-containing protein [Gemmatimonadaceae bacterium]